MYNYASINAEFVVESIITTSEKQDNPKLIEIDSYKEDIVTKIWNPVTKEFDENPNPIVVPKQNSANT